MSNCFWKICDCPTKTPIGQDCAEHSGVNCSIINGLAISNLTQINDNMTVSLETEIAVLDNDKRTVQNSVRAIEYRMADLERKHDELERSTNSANSIGDRRRVIQQAKRNIATFTQEKNKIKSELDDLQQIIDNPRASIRIVKARLNIPYRNPAGFCSCNSRKLQMLDILATQISYWENEQSRLLGRLRVLIQYSQMQWILAVPPTIGIIATLIAIIAFGWGFMALILPVLAFMLVVLLLMASHIRIHNTTLDLINADRILCVLILEYYRIQQIPVCQRPAQDPAVPWDWWSDWLEDLLGSMLPSGQREPALPPEQEIPQE